MRKLGYFDGVATALWLLAFAGAAVLGSGSPGLAEMYRSMNPAAINGTTKLVLSPVWYIAVPVTILGAMVAALVWRPRYAVVGVAAASVVIVVFWYFAAYAPIYSIAGSIR